MPTLKKLNCPSCGAPLEIKPWLDRAVCNYCGSTYRVENSASPRSSFRSPTNGSNPVDIRVVPVPAAEIQLHNNYDVGYLTWIDRCKNRYSDEQKKFDKEYLEQQIQLLSAVSFALADTYVAAIKFNTKSKSINDRPKELMRVFQEESNFFRSTNAVHRKYSKLIDDRITKIASDWGFSESASESDGIDRDRIFTMKITPVTAKKTLGDEFVRTMERIQQYDFLEPV